MVFTKRLREGVRQGKITCSVQRGIFDPYGFPLRHDGAVKPPRLEDLSTEDLQRILAEPARTHRTPNLHLQSRSRVTHPDRPKGTPEELPSTEVITILSQNTGKTLLASDAAFCVQPT